MSYELIFTFGCHLKTLENVVIKNISFFQLTHLDILKNKTPFGNIKRGMFKNEPQSHDYN